MLDYKELYLTMLRASEEAIRVLSEAQRACEARYCDDTAPELIVLPETDAQK